MGVPVGAANAAAAAAPPPPDCPICHDVMLADDHIYLTACHASHRAHLTCAAGWSNICSGRGQAFRCWSCRANLPLPQLPPLSVNQLASQRLISALAFLASAENNWGAFDEPSWENLHPTSNAQIDRKEVRELLARRRRDLLYKRNKYIRDLNAYWANMRKKMYNDRKRLIKVMRQLALYNLAISRLRIEAAFTGRNLDAEDSEPDLNLQ